MTVVTPADTFRRHVVAERSDRPLLDGRLRDLLAGKKILMTGVTGFIGEQLLWKILTDLPDTQNLCPGGVVLRKKAKAYSKMMLAAQLLHLPEDPMLTHLAAA